MANYDDEQKAFDAAIQDEHAGQALSVLGYGLLIFAVLPAVFVLVGWRSGSLLWLWLVLVLAAAGMGFVAAGVHYQLRAAKDIAVLGDTIRAAVSSSLQARELPPAEKVEEGAQPESERDRAA